MGKISQKILNHLIHFIKSVRFFPIETITFVIIFILAITHTAFDTHLILLISCCFIAFTIRTATLHPDIEKYRRIVYYSILIPLASIPFISLSGHERIVGGIFILSIVLPFLAKKLKGRKPFAKHFLSIWGDILITILIISPSLILVVSPLYTNVSFVLANILKPTTTFLFVVGVPVIFFFRQLTPGEKRPFSSTFFYILTNFILSPLAVLCTICVYLSSIAILSGCEMCDDNPLIIMIVYFILVFVARKGHDVAGIHLFDRFFDNLKFIIIFPIVLFWILFFSLLSCPCENGWHYLQHSWLYFYIGIFMIVVDIFLWFKKTDNNLFVWWVGLILSELITFVPYLQNARLCMTQVDKFLENNKLVDSTGRLTQDIIREVDFNPHEFHRFNNARITVYCNDSSLLSNKNPYIIYKDWQEYQPKQITETEVEIKKDTVLIDSIHVAYNGQIIGWLYTSKTNGEKLYIPLNKENHTGYWSSILDVSCDNQAICIEHRVYNPVERIENICHDYHYLQRENPYHIRPVKCDKQEQKKAEDNFWQDTTIIYSRVEKKAEYIGGKEALFRDIKNNLVYPEKAKKEMMEGRVFVKFVVKRDSSTCNHEIVRGVDPDLDQAALQTVKKLGRWEPAKINGKSVNSYFMLPITFRLSDACR